MRIQNKIIFYVGAQFTEIEKILQTFVTLDDATQTYETKSIAEKMAQFMKVLLVLNGQMNTVVNMKS